MAFFIQSKFIDINSLIDFSEFEEMLLKQAAEIVENPPEQEAEFPTDFQIFDKISGQISENDNPIFNVIFEQSDKPDDNPQPKTETSVVSKQLNMPEPVKIAVPKPLAPKPEVLDKKSLQIKFINEKYEQLVAAYFISILLNPVVVSFGYRFDFGNFKVNSSLGNLHILKRGKNSVAERESENQKRRRTEQQNRREIEGNRRKHLNEIPDSEKISLKREISFQQIYKTKV